MCNPAGEDGLPALVPVACQTMHFGKDVVFRAEWRRGDGGETQEVFVKGATVDIEDERHARVRRKKNRLRSMEYD